MSTEPRTVPECNYKGILLDRCTRYSGGYCIRCGKKKGA